MKTSKMFLTIILGLAAFIVSQLGAEIFTGLLSFMALPQWVYHILCGVIEVVIAYALFGLICRKYLQADMAEYYIPRCKVQIKWIIAAVLLPVSVTLTYLAMRGELIPNQIDRAAGAAFVMFGIFRAGVSAGIVEEMLFRGIIMNAVDRRFGRKAAVIAPSVLFGAIHIIGNDFNLLSCLQVLVAGTMVGVMFSLVALANRSIWNSAVIHGVWNLIIIGGILSIGTEVDQYAIYSYVLETRSFLLTGGEFGIEASVIAIAGYCIVSVIAAVSCIKVSCSKEERNRKLHGAGTDNRTGA